MSAFTSLFTRVRDYVGPRILPTGDKPGDGRNRQGQPPPLSATRFHLADLETAIIAADNGNMRLPGQLCRALRRDGTIAGVLSTRTQGLVQLPLLYSGEEDQVEALASEFRTVFPTSELALFSGDGGIAGVGLAEFVQAPGALPVFTRRDPQFLQYRWSDDQWFYQTIRGLVPVNPGDGRWVLHCPGGAVEPWSYGLWGALARAYIAKEHAFYFRENYANKLANAARVATHPHGATVAQQLSFFQKVAAWGTNTVFSLPPGWDVKLLESKGEGHQVFQDIIKTSNEEIVITLAGQTVTTDGGAGFQNSDIHKTIRSDLIQGDADALAQTLATQALPVWANERFGAEGAERARRSLRVTWDVTPPKDLMAEATAMTAAATAAKAMNELLNPKGQEVDVVELARRYRVPVKELEKAIADDKRKPLVALPGGREAA